MLTAVFAALTASLAPPPTTVTCEPVLVCALVAMDDAEESLKQLQKEWDDAQAAYQKAMREASADERKELRGTAPKAEQYAPRFLELAKKYPKTDVAAHALGWVAQNSRNSKVSGEALKALIDDHIESEVIGNLCGKLEGDHIEGAGLLQRVIDESPHHAVQGNAALALGRNLMDAAEIAEGIKAGMGEMYTGWYGKEVVDALASVDPGELSAAAVEYLSLASEKYGDVKRGRSTLAAQAKGPLYELQTLWFGMVAPEIEAEDIDGVTFKLSDYRGKVVVLDFWGDW